jgi:hypothetical protein
MHQFNLGPVYHIVENASLNGPKINCFIPRLYSHLAKYRMLVEAHTFQSL